MATTSTLTDIELISLVKEGDQAAFAEIYNRYFSVLYQHAYNRVRSRDEAKDVVQELFANLWSKHQVLDLKQNISNYLFTAVKNQLLNLIAHKTVEERYLYALPCDVNTSQLVTDYQLRERQLAAIIESEVQALPPKMRAVFEMSRKDHLTYKEISEHLGLSEQTVRSHVKNALKILRTKLGILIYLFYIFYK